MTFTIEQRQLSDRVGKAVNDRSSSVCCHTLDADTPDEAVQVFVEREEGTLLGNILKFPGSRAVATVRTPCGIFTLQVAPAGD